MNVCLFESLNLIALTGSLFLKGSLFVFLSGDGLVVLDSLNIFLCFKLLEELLMTNQDAVRVGYGISKFCQIS